MLIDLYTNFVLGNKYFKYFKNKLIVNIRLNQI